MKQAAHIPKAILSYFFLFATFLLFFSHAEIAAQGIQRGIALCGKTLFPSLFPFLVLSELFVASDIGDTLGNVLGKPFSFLLGTSPRGTGAYLMGIFCGQPVATGCALAFYERREISQHELRRLSLFANNPGTGFLIGAVGLSLFNSRRLGIALFLITHLSALSVGILLHFFDKEAPTFLETPHNGAKKALCAADFTMAVKRAFFTLLQVCAFLVFFSALGNCLACLLSAARLSAACNALIFGVLEITSGIELAAHTLPLFTAFRLSAFFAAFGGLSVCFQILSIADGQGLRFPSYFLVKLLQGILALLFCDLYLQICNGNVLQLLPLFAGAALAVLFLFIFKRKKRRA